MKQKTQHTDTLRRQAAGWLPLAACVLMLAACTADDTWSGKDADGTPVAFTAGIQSVALPAAQPATPHTRTATASDGETVWTQGDAVGVFMLSAGGTSPADILSGAANIPYTVDPATGALTHATTRIYYPQGKTVDFIAYYPSAAKSGGKVTEDYKYPISLADQSDPASIDILRATATGKEKSKTPVGLPFTHVLSKIVLDITLGKGLSALPAGKITGATLAGMPASATLSLTEGSLTPGTAADMAARRESAPSAGAKATFTALVPPQSTPAPPDRRILVTVDGSTYAAAIPADHAYDPNSVYIYPITVQKTGIIVGKRTITDWTTHANGESTVEEIGKGIEKVRIPAGTFQMGSPDTDPDAESDEKPRHWVKLTQDFYLSKYEVTRTQYAAFLNAAGVPKAEVGQFAKATVDGVERELFQVNQWGWTPKWNDAAGKWEAEGDYPMIYVTWYGAKAYAEWVGGRLPTEAEWEYACRAGTQTRYFFGDDASLLDDYDVYLDNHTGNPSPVGTKKPNPWGLYDMHGNVGEWCLDSGDGSNNYPTTATETDAVADPLVYDPAHSFRVCRGGGWASHGLSCRSAYRNNDRPNLYYATIGFRVLFIL